MVRKDKSVEPDPLTVDFIGGAVGYRFRAGCGRGQDLNQLWGEPYP